MKRFKFFTDFEKEEKWLNEMAREGYAFTKKSIGYEFQPAEPERASIKIDYRSFKNKESFEDYRALFDDSGWKHIAGTKSSGLQYFKRKDESGSEDIFSDIDSKAGRYQRLAHMWITLAFTFIPIFIALSMNRAIQVEALLNPKLLYYTPGLWEKAGMAFVGAFLFETPFVLLRLSWLSFPVLIFLYFIFAAKAKKQYQRTLKEGSGKV